MGNLIVTEFITVDGVIDSPGEGGWAFKFNRGEDGDKFKLDELIAADAQLLGRVTYQAFAQAWPAMGNDGFGKPVQRGRQADRPPADRLAAGRARRCDHPHLPAAESICMNTARARRSVPWW